MVSLCSWVSVVLVLVWVVVFGVVLLCMMVDKVRVVLVLGLLGCSLVVVLKVLLVFLKLFFISWVLLVSSSVLVLVLLFFNMGCSVFSVLVGVWCCSCRLVNWWCSVGFLGVSLVVWFSRFFVLVSLLSCWWVLEVRCSSGR